jgi:hypothetical protein
MPKKIAIYLNLVYSQVDTGHFFHRISATLLTDSVGNVITSDGNNKMILIVDIMVTDIFTISKSNKLFEKLHVLLISHWVLN